MNSLRTSVEAEGRIVGLDIFRIVSMCGIVGLHLLNNGGVIGSADRSSVRYPILLALLSVFFLSVNCFALLSGYLLIKKKQRGTKRIVELIMTVIIIAFTITAIFYIFNIADVRSQGLGLLAKSLFPFGCYYWYITCYIFLFFMMPYINRFIASIDRRTYKRLIITVGILLSVVPNLFMQTDFFRINDGYSPFWLIFCYLVGGYLKLYPPKIRTKKCVTRLAITIVVMVVINYTWRIVSDKFFGHSIHETWLIGYTSPLNLYASAMLLIIFSRIRTVGKKITNSVIMSLSAAAFTVYISHGQYLFFYCVMKDSFAFTNEMPLVIQLLIIIGTICVLYIVGFVIEMIRKPAFRILKINTLIVRVGDIIDGKKAGVERES